MEFLKGMHERLLTVASRPPPPFLLGRALLQADVVLLLGARLNWILHFGLPPRFDPNVKIIQV